MSPLAELEVLVVDCQATAARGHLLELGWARVGAGVVNAKARLVKLPSSARISPAVVRVTGISERLLWDAVAAPVAWRELITEAALLSFQPAPAVAHFARFEQPFLDALSAERPALELVCTHELSRRLFPELPRRSLRALAGYFGHAVGTLRRAADHVEATAFVWRELVKLLGQRGVETWPQLRAFLATPVDPKARAKKAWPMPRELRLALPDAPGLYRMLRTSGDVLYVGKASSLRQRVNSYFRKQRGIHERTLEMLSQARGVSFVVTQSPLEAALLEPDEIKLHHPPYNVALTVHERAVWFASTELSRWTMKPDAAHPVGPFPSAEPLAQLAALARANGAALGTGRWSPPSEIFHAAFARLSLAHPELRDGVSSGQLLRLGTRLWREGRRDHEESEDEAPEWTPELAFRALEWVTIRAALARRRARWFTRLTESTLLWSERGAARLLTVEGGELSVRDADGVAPVPVHHARPSLERHERVSLAVFDRLRVLTTELKRLVGEEGASATLRLGPSAVLDSAGLSRALHWV